MRVTVFEDGGVNDIQELYAAQDAITDAGGQLTRDVHRSIDAIRTCWDRVLRDVQNDNIRLKAEVAELRRQLAVEDECVMAPKTLIGLGMAMTPAWHELYTDANGHALQVFAGDAAIRIVTDPAGCTVPLGVVEAAVRALREAARRSTPKEG